MGAGSSIGAVVVAVVTGAATVVVVGGTSWAKSAEAALHEAPIRAISRRTMAAGSFMV